MSTFLNDSALDDESVESDGSAIEVPETPVDSFIVDDDDDSSDDDDNEEVSTRKDQTPAKNLTKSDHDTDNEISMIKLVRNKKRNILLSDSEDSEDDGGVAKSGYSNKVTAILDNTSTSDEEEEAEKIERKIEKYQFSPKTRKSIGVQRIMSDSESEVESSNENSLDNDQFQIPDGFSSTMMVQKGQNLSSNNISKNKSEINMTLYRSKEIPESDESSDLVILETEKEPTINISDDNDSDVQIEEVLNKTPDFKPKLEKTMTDSAKRLIQPKLTDFNFAKVKVPQEIYDEQLENLTRMQNDLENQEKLLKTVGKTMFDGGLKLQNKIQDLRREVQAQRSNVDKLEPVPKPKPEIKAPSWDELEGMLKTEQPKHFGKQGIKTFETQKALTMETLKDMHGCLSNCPEETEILETPKYVQVELMGHQKHALAFMTWRETQKPRGGMLADDMGLGKTLTMLSLVAMDLEKQHNEDGDKEDLDSENEEEGKSLNKSKDKTKKTTTGWSTKGRRDYYDGGTLVICPASLLQQWEGEVKSKLKRNALNYLVYHGTNRDSRGRYLSEYDLVITTYSIASVDKKSNIGLYRVKWNRIILDEGHAIRNHKSQMSMAACELMARKRWLLTGTPIHNKEMDMFAVLKFLRCEPFNDLVYFKKWIDNKTSSGKQRLSTLLKSIMLRRTKVQLQSRGELDSLPDKKIVTIDVKMDKEEMNVYQRVMIYSRTLFAQFLHQRAEKITGQLEARNPNSNDPNSVYYNIHKKMVRMNGQTASSQVKQYQILLLLLRLRQICCHPGLIDAMLDNNEFSDMDSSEDHSELDLLNQLENLTITDDSQENPNDQNHKKERILVSSNPVFNLTRPSSKFRKIMEMINDLLKSDDKIVIVSQWSSVLDILEKYTEERKIPTTKLTGKVNVKDRAQVVEQFNRVNSGPKILFLSLTAGGVGLNLVGGNHLFLIDLHWNPQLEKQAQDRVHRFGQKKPVTIYKFMVSDSIEQRIQALQEHKLAIADSILTGSISSSGGKLTIADLKTLFDMD